MNIHFKRQDNGSTLATVVMIVAGASAPKFYRMTLAEGVDPWGAYSDVAAQAVDYLQRHEDKRTDKEKPAGGKRAKAGRLIQLHGALPMG